MIDMKKYKRKTPLFSTAKIAIAALCAVIVTVAGAIVAGSESGWFIISCAITAIIFIGLISNMIVAALKYGYSDECIEVFFSFLPYRKLDYSRFSALIISNASYNNGFGYGVNGNVPMQYKCDNGHTKVTFPFITLHKAQYPFDKISEGMSSRDLFMLNPDEIYCLGICWADSFRELLAHTNCPVYILEDVYLRFKEQFTADFSQHIEDLSRFYIITDRIIAFKTYSEATMRDISKANS